MARSIELVPAYGWDCIVCGRPAFQRLPVLTFDWNSVEDMKTLEVSFSTEELAALRESHPGILQLFETPQYLRCNHCNVEFPMPGDDETPIPPAVIPEPEPMPQPLATLRNSARFGWTLKEQSGNRFSIILPNNLKPVPEIGIGYGRGKFGNAAKFVGLTAGLVSESPVSCGGVTPIWFSAWVKLSALPTAGQAHTIFKATAEDGTGFSFVCEPNPNGQVNWVWRHNGGGAEFINRHRFGPVVNIWHSLLVRFDPVSGVGGISMDGAAFEVAMPAPGTASAKFGPLAVGLNLVGLVDNLVYGEGYVPTDADAAELWKGVAVEDWKAMPAVSFSVAT